MWKQVLGVSVCGVGGRIVAVVEVVIVLKNLTGTGVESQF